MTKPLSERMCDPFGDDADVSRVSGVERWWFQMLQKYAEEVAQLEAYADALASEHELLKGAYGELETKNEKLRELKNFCYAEAQTQGDGRDFSLAAYMLRDLPTTKRAELTELCQAMSNETASKSDWEGLKQWWLEAALKGDDDGTE